SNVPRAPFTDQPDGPPPRMSASQLTAAAPRGTAAPMRSVTSTAPSRIDDLYGCARAALMGPPSPSAYSHDANTNRRGRQPGGVSAPARPCFAATLQPYGEAK